MTYNSKDAGTKVFLALIKATGFVGCAVMKSDPSTVGAGFIEAAAKLPQKTGGSSKNLTICNLRSSLMRIETEFSIFYPYFLGGKTNVCLQFLLKSSLAAASVHPRPNPRDGNHSIFPVPHIFDMFCGGRAGINPAPTSGSPSPSGGFVGAGVIPAQPFARIYKQTRIQEYPLEFVNASP